MEEATITTIAAGPFVRIRAAPVYRLIISPQLADRPSRLLVLYARIQTHDEGTIHFHPSDVRLTLPSGAAAFAFDRPRSAELLRRAGLGANYLSRRDRGRLGRATEALDREAESRLKASLIKRLLDETTFTRDDVLEGFLLVDTGQPLSSLDGVVVEVIATGRHDAVPARHAGQSLDEAAHPENHSSD